MLWITRFWATIIFCWHFYLQYHMNGNSKACEPYVFPKELSKIFKVNLDILPKLWLIFCCHQQNIQKLSHFWHINDHNSWSKHGNQTNNLVFIISL